jgi:chromosome segregation ATPase
MSKVILNADQSNFFEKIRDAINEYMLNQYPLFDEALAKKIHVLETQFQIARKVVADHTKTIEENKVLQLDFFKQEINRFLSLEHPGVASKLFNLSENLEKLSKKIQKSNDEVEKKLKKVIDCQSLYEDVYKMRDEMKNVQKEWKSFSEKLKKIFN